MHTVVLIKVMNRCMPLVFFYRVKFRTFFDAATNVLPLEREFNQSEYSEDTLVVKPSIYISQFDIQCMHECLVKNIADIIETSKPGVIQVYVG